MIVTIIIFLIVIGLLVLVHEFGHFIIAKTTGVKVEEFAIGFPPRLLSLKKGETKYSINAIPLGGYVKMLGELEHSKDKRAFENQKPSVRFWISIAGVLMNLILAWFILTIGFSVGMSPLVSTPDEIPGQKIKSEVIVAEITKDSPAEKSDFKQGDIILGTEKDGQRNNFSSAKNIINFNSDNKGKEITFIIKRDNKEIVLPVTLANTDTSQLGVALVEKSEVKVPWYKAPYVALRETVQIVKLTFAFLGDFFVNLFSHGKVSEGVGGPIAIYTYTGLALKAGIMVLLQFIALLSINLAFLNILPFPALDGGRLVFILIEKIFGKRVVREQVENIIHTIGFALLILLMIAITYKDIIGLFNK